MMIMTMIMTLMIMTDDHNDYDDNNDYHDDDND